MQQGWSPSCHLLYRAAVGFSSSHLRRLAGSGADTGDWLPRLSYLKEPLSGSILMAANSDVCDWSLSHKPPRPEEATNHCLAQGRRGYDNSSRSYYWRSYYCLAASLGRHELHKTFILGPQRLTSARAHSSIILAFVATEFPTPPQRVRSS